MVRDLEPMLCGKRLEEQVCSAWKGMAERGLTAVLRYLEKVYREGGAILFSEMKT